MAAMITIITNLLLQKTSLNTIPISCHFTYYITFSLWYFKNYVIFALKVRLVLLVARKFSVYIFTYILFFLLQRKEYVKYAKVFPFAEMLDLKIPSKWYRRAVGSLEIICGLAMVIIPNRK